MLVCLFRFANLGRSELVASYRDPCLTLGQDILYERHFSGHGNARMNLTNKTEHHFERGDAGDSLTAALMANSVCKRC